MEVESDHSHCSVADTVDVQDTGKAPAPGELSRLNLIFPSVSLTAMLGGQAVMTRLISWREQGFFQRMACTSVPLGLLVIGTGVAQTVISTMQAVVIVFAGLAMGQPVDVFKALAATGILILSAVCFVAYGMLVASLLNKAEFGGAVFMFTLLPRRAVHRIPDRDNPRY